MKTGISPQHRRVLLAIAILLNAFACGTAAPSTVNPGVPAAGYKNGYADSDTIIVTAVGDAPSATDDRKKDEALALAVSRGKIHKSFMGICLDMDFEENQRICNAASVVCGESKFSKEYPVFRGKVKRRKLEEDCRDTAQNVECRVTYEYKLPELKQACLKLRRNYFSCCDGYNF